MTISRSTVPHEDIEDPVTLMLKKTGCIEIHYRLQECMAEHQDWRKCQKDTKELKLCMEEYRRQQEKTHSSA